MKKNTEYICSICGFQLLYDTNYKICMKCLLFSEGIIENIEGFDMHIFLNNIIESFAGDITTVFIKDPAASNIIEVITAYPGIQAVLIYRIANMFYRIGIPYIPRFLSHIARTITQIEIHPGASIGNDFFIDHGSGVVIGETTEIGNNVTIYQNVTLGGTSTEKKKRHPTINDNVVIGAGAKILGPIVIGKNVRIGANAVVTKDIPPNSVVVGENKIVHRDDKKIPKIDLEHGDLPDPVKDSINDMDIRIKELERHINDNK